MLKRRVGALIGLVGMLVAVSATAVQARPPGATLIGSQKPTEIPTATIAAEPVTITDVLVEEDPGRIIVRKVTAPGAPAVVFTFDPSWGSDFGLAGGDQMDSGPLAAGVYSVAEVLPLPAGWWAGAASCDDGSAVSAIGVSAGETVTCTFHNDYEEVQTPKASLTIIKDAAALVEPDDAVFRFRGDLGGFGLGDGEARTFAELEPGAYTVRELEAGGWHFDRVECIAGDWSSRGRSVTVNLTQGEAAVCTFYNEEEAVAGPTGSLTLLEETNPAGGEGFYFTVSENLGGPFILDDGGSLVFAELEAGAYTVTGAPAGDWTLQRLECTAGDYEVEGISVTVNLAEGEAAVCTFTHAAGELPYTGPGALTLALLVGGLCALGVGPVLMVRSRER